METQHCTPKKFFCKCSVHNKVKEALGKFDPRSDEGIFLGYSSTSRAYKVYNKKTMLVEESVHVVFDESDVLPEVLDTDDEL